ncbi:hypothetical protein MNBD_GAMMA08-2912 [hydrothermal vent metagenome]|uniref:Organic solvent tolerance-like N-terminal domain-containing protein n=1 Tax=hydrothermal vent metagenome TaxID=652676 RepID=A0A3B0X140_9ZZZZ
MKRLIKIEQAFILLCALCFNVNTYAKKVDKEAPINIEADQLEMREKEGISIYKGHVIATKGSIKINGDKLIIKHKNGVLNKINIYGKPATFYQLNDLNETISAESYFMEYRAKTGMLEMKQKALLLKNKNRFSSEHIIYNTHKDIVKAGNGNTTSTPDTGAEKNRVKITIHPEADKNKPAKTEAVKTEAIKTESSK